MRVVVLAVLLQGASSEESAPCVPHDAVCTKELRPVCAAGVTYANACLARAACHGDDFVQGACSDGKAKGAPHTAGLPEHLLVGGVPVGGGPSTNDAFGGHYTASAESGEVGEAGSVAPEKSDASTARLPEYLLVGGVPFGAGPATNEAFGGHYTASAESGEVGEAAPEKSDESDLGAAGLLVGGVPVGGGPATNEAFGGHYTASAESGANETGSAEVGSAEPECTGGQVWRECGSACTHTCTSPGPLACVLMCVPRCECPAEQPIWHEGSCIVAEECPPEEKALLGLQARAAPNSTPTAAPLLPGGVMPLGEAEVGPGSKASRLASLGLSALQSKICSASNSLGCARLQGAAMDRVLSASTQVVAGLNSVVVAQTSAGELTLAFFEQSWTQTLELIQASLTTPVGGASEALMVTELLDQPLALDLDDLAPAPGYSSNASTAPSVAALADAAVAPTAAAATAASVATPNTQPAAEGADAPTGGQEPAFTAPGEKAAAFAFSSGSASYPLPGIAPPEAKHEPPEKGTARSLRAPEQGAESRPRSDTRRLLDLGLVSAAVVGLVFLAVRVAPKTPWASGRVSGLGASQIDLV